MAAGTATLGDSYYLSLSPVFKGRVQSALVLICTQISSEGINSVGGVMPMIVHQQRKSFVATILNPSNFATWLAQFVLLVSVDSATVAAATLAASNYTPVTSQALGDSAAAQGGNISDATIENAVSAAFNAVIPGL